MAFPTAKLLIVISSATAAAFESDIISDIVTPKSDERRALQIKSDEFWNIVKEAAQQTHIDAHLEVYADVEAAITALPEENKHVRDLLTEALLRLRRADAKVLQQTVQASELASERLLTTSSGDTPFSFLTGGQNFLALAINRFIGGGQYTSKLTTQISDRQADILPVLREAASITGNVLGDCRLASKLGFDVLKYDIYNKGVPKTPPSATAAANKLVDAAGQTRHNFMQGITGIVNAIAKDTQEKHVDPSAKVTRTLMEDLKPFGSQVENRGAGFTVAHEEQTIVDFKGM